MVMPAPDPPVFAKSHRPVRSSFALDSRPFGPAESNVSCSLTREEDVVEGVVEGDDVVASKKSLLTLSQYVHCVVSAVICVVAGKESLLTLS